ncbi:hypothetical protein KIN20_023415 [Parelaphostrongylus tenuis]|uniref:Uncharacterized protein n=1 Tax=Parelaphostrongylus tenuis TaxID=148309 RepID=A0AAD5NA32_PARTN|nr:hypothetical protein KIN20_023415 [Parelaphostrongylus tenuis]
MEEIEEPTLLQCTFSDIKWLTHKRWLTTNHNTIASHSNESRGRESELRTEAGNQRQDQWQTQEDIRPSTTPTRLDREPAEVGGATVAGTVMVSQQYL